jgi:hypothetical protein
MSGGSYNYLYCKDSSDLLAGSSDEELQQMSDRLAELGYAKDAASETQYLLLTIRQCRNRIETSRKRLEQLWKAIEYWDSNDSSEQSFKEELNKYRSK